MQRSAARHEDKIFVHYEGNWNGSKTVYITNASQPLRNKRKSREGSYHTWKDNPNGMLEEESSTTLDPKIVAKYALKNLKKMLHMDSRTHTIDTKTSSFQIDLYPRGPI